MKVSACLAALVAATVSGCGRENPTGPAVPPPQIFVVCPEFGESSRCFAHALFDNGDSRDITGLADWSTGDAAIANVSSTGSVTVHTTGAYGSRVQDASVLAQQRLQLGAPGINAAIDALSVRHAQP